MGIQASTLLPGTLDLLILRTLASGSRHGYGIARHLEGRGGEHFGIEQSELEDWITRLGSLASAAGYYSRELTLRGFGEARPIRVTYVTDDFFDVLGVAAAVGRTTSFDQTDDLVVMSHQLASQSQGESVNSVLGAGLTLGERLHTVVGVMPRNFAFPTSRTDVWIRTPRSNVRVGNVGAHRLVGRLRDGATLADVRHEANALLRERHPSGNLSRAVVASFEDRAFEDVRPTMLVFLAAGALVLIISCANVPSSSSVAPSGASRTARSASHSAAAGVVCSAPAWSRASSLRRAACCWDCSWQGQRCG